MSSTPSPGERGALDVSSEEINKLRGDVASLKDTIARLASQLSSEAGKTVRGLTQTAAAHVEAPPAEWQMQDPSSPPPPRSAPRR